MTCKDCLHYEACAKKGRHFAKTYGKGHHAETYVEDVELKCKHFKNKSEWVHVPCKVGDVVYCFEPCFDTSHHPKLKVVEKEVVEVKTIATVFGLNFDVKSIGKTIFLSREEAEKELSEMRKEDEWK